MYRRIYGFNHKMCADDEKLRTRCPLQNALEKYTSIIFFTPDWQDYRITIDS